MAESSNFIVARFDRESIRKGDLKEVIPKRYQILQKREEAVRLQGDEGREDKK